MTLYRHRWLRWAAAACAALLVLIALSDNGDGPEPTAEQTAATPADLLPEGTRGVPVTVDHATYTVGDSVDVHAVFDGASVVRSALVVEVAEDEVVVAVPVEQVDSTIDALTTGGVILVLVPDAR